MHERRKTSQARKIRRRRRGRLCELNRRLVGHCWAQSLGSLQVRCFSSGLPVLLHVSCYTCLAYSCCRSCRRENCCSLATAPRTQDDYVICKVFINLMFSMFDRIVVATGRCFDSPCAPHACVQLDPSAHEHETNQHHRHFLHFHSHRSTAWQRSVHACMSALPKHLIVRAEMAAALHAGERMASVVAVTMEVEMP